MIHMSPEIFPPDSQLATRVALLDAAERLFSQNGVEGTSVREIIKAAETNLGAINYHFGSKDRLALEVFARRIQPVNRERIARLDVLEAGNEPGKLIARTNPRGAGPYRPWKARGNSGAKNCDDFFMRLISRSFQEPNPEVKKFVEEQFAEVVSRFDFRDRAGLAGVCSPRGVLFWRMTFVHGALHHGLQTWLRFDQVPYAMLNPAAEKPDREGLIRRMISFMAAGLSAGWAGTPTSNNPQAEPEAAWETDHHPLP